MWRAGSVWRLLDLRAKGLANFEIHQECRSAAPGSCTSATVSLTVSLCLTGRGGMCDVSEREEQGRGSLRLLVGFASRATATSSWPTVIIIECRLCGRTGRLCGRLDLKGWRTAS